MDTVILANGPLSDFNTILVDMLEQAKIIIAVDGGGNHCLDLGVVPDILIGDFDSIKKEPFEFFEKKGVSIHRFSTKKDATDLELALDIAQVKGGKQICLAGVLGGRWDMSLANILLAAQEKYRSLQITLWSSDCIIMLNYPEQTNQIRGHKGKTVSFLPLQGDVCGISLTGFTYPLEDHTIAFGSTLGVSNIIESDVAIEYHDSGILLCIILT